MTWRSQIGIRSPFAPTTARVGHNIATARPGLWIMISHRTKASLAPFLSRMPAKST
ncbi:hypothetical protein LEL_04611 [Akanthomyces lecanii RCEF 1005]|uniref:Uncharacterized protein n=1 Tax=Akanthomyces lecanii RCEF 1005 TaxID=1081108 RepID=A0A162KP01_CORDF|nr:hypothetical protein LEL_04611 [Akanthomyces lecanii RCEF 1005]